MNEYLLDIMIDANLTDDEWDRITKKHRGKSYNKKLLSNTLDLECLTTENCCNFDSYK